MKWKSLIMALASLLRVAAYADCPRGDFNGDCRVDAADLVLFTRQWLTASNASADLNRDGIVNGVDWALLSSQWYQKIGRAHV